MGYLPKIIVAFIWLTASAAGLAQLSLPTGRLPKIAVPEVIGKIDLPELDGSRLSSALRSARANRLKVFADSNRDVIEMDGNRYPAKRGILIANNISEAEMDIASDAGFKIQSTEQIADLEITLVTFMVPDGMGLKKARKKLEKIAPAANIDADHIYFPSGGTALHIAAAATADASFSTKQVALGLIDSGVANHASLTAGVEQKGFAAGAPRASDHGTSVAALLVGSGAVRGGAPGKPLLVADVYGSDRAGGNASAIAKGLGWLASRGVAVVTISLIGPDNALLKAAVKKAQGKGMIIVAAVGNDGPASPPPYPASYYGVLGVTGVDSRNRALPEAGRSPSLAFAAPGADILSATMNGGSVKVRGTSFAAPLVAGRLSLFYSRPSPPDIAPSIRKLMAEAIDLGKSGYDKIYGNGLVCRTCASK